MYDLENSGLRQVAQSEDLSRTASRKARLKILMLRVRLLYPQDSGGKIRTGKLLEELARENDVTLVTYRYPEDTAQDVSRTAKLCHQLITVPFRETPKHTPRFYVELGKNVFDSLPYIVSKYAGKEMARTVAKLYDIERFDLVLCDFLQACEALRELPNVPFVLFQHNVEARIFEQLAHKANSRVKRAYLSLQARRVRNYERLQCQRAQRIIAVSDVDKEAFRTEYGCSHCDVVPTGVDIDFFRPARTPCPVNNLVFTGSMDWMANQDAMQYFVKDILPLIQQEVPNVVFSIVGRNPPPEITVLGQLPGVHVTGTVNDIRPYVHGSKVYVVPLRIGSGTRIKLLEAMAMGKATVSTSIGAEGLPVENGKNIVLADNPDAFAREVIELLRNNERRSELELNARELVERDYSWEQAGRVFNDICYQAALQTREEHL